MKLSTNSGDDPDTPVPGVLGDTLGAGAGSSQLLPGWEERLGSADLRARAVLPRDQREQPRAGACRYKPWESYWTGIYTSAGEFHTPIIRFPNYLTYWYANDIVDTTYLFILFLTKLFHNYQCLTHWSVFWKKKCYLVFFSVLNFIIFSTHKWI